MLEVVVLPVVDSESDSQSVAQCGSLAVCFDVAVAVGDVVVFGVFRTDDLHAGVDVREFGMDVDVIIIAPDDVTDDRVPRIIWSQRRDIVRGAGVAAVGPVDSGLTGQSGSVGIT